MNWLDLCYNPLAITSDFSTPPSLERFEMVDVSLMRHNSSLHLSGIIPERPDLYLARGGDADIDAVHLTLCFWEVSELLIEGVLRDQVAPLRILKGRDSQVVFDFAGETFLCRGTAGYMMVEGRSWASLAPKSPPGPRLFSYRNVWNSCLLWVRSKGFKLRLFGSPDEHGTSAHCQWQATKDDGTELTGGSPIELAGLVALYEHHQPDRNRDYWWTIDGPNLVSELWDEWHAKFFGPQHRQSEG